MPYKNKMRGFTLIELSIVLVIIGLIIGGVLVGQDLITAAAVRAQISQIEKYNTAVNTFRSKFNGLPGDLLASQAAQFNFTAVPTRAGTIGQGNGDGMLQGYGFAGAGVVGDCCTAGETAWFWEDLSANSNLIEGYFNYAATAAYPFNITPTTTPPASSIIPPAKLGNGLYVNVYTANGRNYFNISTISILDGNGALRSTVGQLPGIPAAQAYMIDKKMDDGQPQNGKVTARYQNWDLGSSVGGVIYAQGAVSGATDTSATAGSATTCYDNAGAAGVTQQYSTEQPGNGPNCALSFQFQ